MNGRLIGAVACRLGVPWPSPADAWGDIGHRIICEIAFQELNEETREHPTEQL